MGGADTLNFPGSIHGVSASNGHELWGVTLPAEDPTVFNPNIGQYGYNQGVNTRGLFSRDGTAAYFMTSTATGSNDTSRSFLYTLDAGGSAPPPPPPTSTKLHVASISLSATQKNGVVTVTGRVGVLDESGAAVRGANVAAAWTLPNGSTQSQTASTDAKGSATFKTSGGRGTYTLRVTGVAKTGTTFDAASSVLVKSVTK